MPNGVVQGLLGDCWFLASCAAIAEYPERIKRIFANQEYSKEGIFKVTFYDSAKPISVVIDDRLPWHKDDFAMDSGESLNGAWW